MNHRISIPGPSGLVGSAVDGAIEERDIEVVRLDSRALRGARIAMPQQEAVQ